ncbi:MAG: DEAD/DEAH box helicase, partial [Microbacteriaceae bacterium]|nr:DEAD/DEAH box helicase [Microbacteriaceae bacterium]
DRDFGGRSERRGDLRADFNNSRDRQQGFGRSDRSDRFEERDYRRDSGARVRVFGDDRRDFDREERRDFNERDGYRAERRDFSEREERSSRGFGRVSRDRDDRFAGRERDRFDRRDRGDRFDRRDRDFSGSKGGFQPPEDVVLERLESQKTSAADIADLTFADLGLGDRIVSALAEMGATAPFAIQAATIPVVLEGRDVLGRGRTGSGKTIAFGAALVERLLQLKSEGLFANDPQMPKAERGKRRAFIQGRAPKALILAPTRELALQIDRTVQPIARSVGFFTTQVVGGAPIERQKKALHMGVDIVIGTPGRVEDLIERGDLDISRVAIAVLDEADHMAELGFLEPVQRILRGTAPKSQKLLFSATLDAQVTKLVTEFLVEPSVHEVVEHEETGGNIDHHVLVVLREEKNDVLTDLIARAGERTIVFTRTRAYAEMLRELFEDAGVMAVELHGNLNQARRERNLKRFTDGKVGVLVATDVAARGIHVDDVELVLQADPPDDYKSYLHRAGRTGRAGRNGTVVTVIPRNRRRRTEQLFANAQLEAGFFGDFAPGDEQVWQDSDEF